MSLFRPKFRDLKTGELKAAKVWWFKFAWRGASVRESTKHTNKRIAAQIEAARKAELAKGEVGIRDRKPVPTLRGFAENDFLPFVRTTFAAKEKTRRYYENGVKQLLAHAPLASKALDEIKTDEISGFTSKRQSDGLMVASINRELQALRRMFALAQEWGNVERLYRACAWCLVSIAANAC